MNIKTNFHDDFILFFLLTRNAQSIKYIDRAFYTVIYDWDRNDPKVKLRLQFKYEHLDVMRCKAYLNFLDILFKNTKDTLDDKKILISLTERYYFNNLCKDDKENRERAIELFKLYLENKYISDDDKKKVQDFINLSN